MLKQLEVGVITSSHGLKGEVKVYPTTDDASRFELLDYVIADTGRTKTTLEIESVRYFKNMVILKFKGLDKIEDIHKLIKAHLLINREDALKLDEDEYYIGDILDSHVFLEDGSEFGILEDILETGANDVYAIRKTEDNSIVYLPAIKQVILQVDPENQKIIVRPMKEI